MAISKKFFVDINLQGNALTNSTVGANSSMTKAGSFRFDGTRLEYFDGTAVKQVANLSDISAVTGGLILQGAYDAATNTPNITDGNALKGYFWVVTVAGTFLGETVQVGDSIIAKVDNAGALLTDWLILQGNVVIATETVDGIVRLATQAEVNTGTEGGALVLTPATFAASQQLADINTDITNLENDKLSKTGGTMSGNLDMGNMNITNLAGPTEPSDAARKDYVDTIAAAEAESAVNASSYTITIPTSAWETDGTYYYTYPTHPLGKFVNVSVFENLSSPQNVEFNYQVEIDGIILRSNNLPTDDIIVCLNKAGGNLV